MNSDNTKTLKLLELDAARLFERIESRKQDYLFTFSVKRTREHFKEIFKSRYGEFSIADLKECSLDLIEQVDIFYAKVDELKWYLNHTEEMPNKVDDKVEHYIKDLGEIFQELMRQMNISLNGEIDEQTDEIQPIEETWTDEDLAKDRSSL